MSDVSEMKQVAAMVPADLVDQVAALAKAADRSLSAEVRIALKAHVESHQEQVA